MRRRELAQLDEDNEGQEGHANELPWKTDNYSTINRQRQGISQEKGYVEDTGVGRLSIYNNQIVRTKDIVRTRDDEYPVMGRLRITKQ
jgi:hypothetical protein